MRHSAPRPDKSPRSVVLVQPNYRLIRAARQMAISPPLGLLYLAAALEKENIPVGIVDALGDNLSVDETLAAVKDKRPSHVGFTFMTFGADLCADMADRLTKRAGITTVGFFILGLIGDTVRTMRRTIRFAKSLGLDGINLSIATPYPGTRMVRMIGDGGGRIHHRRWNDYLNRVRKMSYRLPGMATEVQVETMFKKALISYYLSPGYILRQAPRLLKPSFNHSIVRALRRLLAHFKE